MDFANELKETRVQLCSCKKNQKMKRMQCMCVSGEMDSFFSCPLNIPHVDVNIFESSAQKEKTSSNSGFKIKQILLSMYIFIHVIITVEFYI